MHTFLSTSLFIFINLFLSAVLAANSSACNSRRLSSEDLQKWREELACRELNVGEKRLVEKTFFSDTGVSATYILSKTSEKEYKVDLPLNLKETGLKGIRRSLGFPANATLEEMQARIRLCTQTSGDFLKGPGGEKIYLNPVFQDDKKTVWHWGLSKNINVIEDNDFRSNSGSYQKDENCPAIIHELLHLLGLVDEYKEKSLKSEESTTGLLANCRIRGPASSIMSNHEVAFSDLNSKNAPDNFEISALVCDKFPGREPVCAKTTALYSGDNPKVEHMAEAFKRHYGDPQKRNLTETPIEITFSNMEFSKIPSKKNVSSVLEPAHFRAIVYPGCQKKNATYYKCAKLAYTSDKIETKTLGIRSPARKCNVPPECLSLDWLK